MSAAAATTAAAAALSCHERGKRAKASISTSPAARPPTWPPIEMPGIANVNTRFSTISPST